MSVHKVIPSVGDHKMCRTVNGMQVGKIFNDDDFMYFGQIPKQ